MVQIDHGNFEINKINEALLVHRLIANIGHIRVLKIGLTVFLASVLEVVGIASIASSLSIIGGSETIQVPLLLQTCLGVVKSDPTVIHANELMVLAFVTLTLTMFVNVVVSYLMFSAVNQNKSMLSTSVLESYLNKPFNEIQTLNTDELGKNILVEVDRISSGILFSLLNTVSSLILLVSLVTLLAMVNTTLLFAATLVLVIIYGLLYIVLGKFISRYGAIVTDVTARRFKLASESLKQIKVIKVSNLEAGIVAKFREYANTKAEYQTRSMALKAMPRFVVEWAIFSATLATILFFFRGETLQEVASVGTIFILAGYKILPALQKIYVGLMDIRQHKSALLLIERELIPNKELRAVRKTNADKLNNGPVGIELINCSLAVTHKNKKILNNISLEVDPGSKVAVIGASGSGKSSLLNLILGLLKPSSGIIRVGQKVLHDEVSTHDWNEILGYVPQSVFLFDDTVAANIAPIEALETIDEDRLQLVSNIATLDTVLEKRGSRFDEEVGDNGIKFSGGEVQRIGIARAIFKSPSILVLDEATSALDANTELKILTNIFNQMPNLTVISVTHRVEYLHLYDLVVTMDGGEFESIHRNGLST